MRSRLLLYLGLMIPGVLHAAEEPADRGSIRGRVLYDGSAPAPQRLKADANVDVCGASKPILAESLVVSPESGLANTAVLLAGVTEREPPAREVQLNQENCVFLPHVQTMTQGASIVISNSDPVIHNVHARIEDDTVFNLGMPLKGVRVKKTIAAPGVVKLNCDSGHTWMEAYVVVVPHSYHATSDGAGQFAIENISPGEYTLRSWHERLGVIDTPVTVKAGAATDVMIKYAEQPAPAPEVQALSFAAPIKVAAHPVPAADETPLPQVKAALESELAEVMRAAELGTRRAAQTANAAAGRALYGRYCAACHGDAGDGRGEAARSLKTRPRDFTRALYKFRSTRTGQLPTEDDLLRTITAGVPGTDMPAWKNILSAEERRTLARYVTTFSQRFVERAPGRSIAIPAETPRTSQSIARGRELYVRLQCGQCHGADARAEGVRKAMADDWGRPIRAADLTRGPYKAGPRPTDTYRTLATGLDGTPMPSFAEMIGSDEIWDVVHYLESLVDDDPLRSILGVP